MSFDGANLTLPHGARQANAAWPHVDQSPRRRGLQCVQGLLNLAPNGPRDGGLIVLRGSSLLNEAFFKAHPGAGERTCKCLSFFFFSLPPPPQYLLLPSLACSRFFFIQSFLLLFRRSSLVSRPSLRLLTPPPGHGSHSSVTHPSIHLCLFFLDK